MFGFVASWVTSFVGVPTLPTALPMMTYPLVSERVQVAIITFILAPLIIALVTLIQAYLNKRLALSPETKQVVAEVTSGTSIPAPEAEVDDFDEALRRLARQVGELDTQVRAYSLYLPMVEAWGERGWQGRVDHQEPKPAKPRGIPKF